MSQFQTEYLKRIDEINEYYLFLEGIDSIETHRKSKVQLPDGSVLPVSRNLQKVLRSYTFLLLYNFIESTLTNGIFEILDHIHDNKININNISEDYQKIWLENKAKQIHEINKEQRLVLILKELINDSLGGNELTFDKKRLSINGNLGFKEIQKLRLKFGLKSKIPNKDVKKLVHSLNVIKTKRNYLAHGNESFSKASELKSFKDLELIKNEIFIYIESIFLNINQFLLNNKFMK